MDDAASSDEQVAAVGRVFDAVSDAYDAVGVEFFGPIGAGLVDRLDPRPGERAVDAGCGRGAALFPLAERVGPTGRVLGIDLAPGMVERTSADVVARGLTDRVQVRQGDVQDPGLPDAAYDVVASSLVLFFLPEPGRALRSWHRALVPGGRIGVTTFGPFDEQWGRVESVFRPFLRPETLDARTRPGAPFASDAAMAAFVADAGFVDVVTHGWTLTVRFDDPEHWHRWSMSVGQRQHWDAMTPAEAADARERGMALVAETRRPDGTHGFDQQIRYTLGRRP